jgi:hypothetical protein
MMSHCVRVNFFLLHHINNNLSYFFHPIVNCTHTYQVELNVHQRNDLSNFYQSSSALYRNNIDNEMLVIIIRRISKCICILF